MQALTLPKATGLRQARPVLQSRPSICAQPHIQHTRRSRSSVVVRADFIGSPTNIIMVASTSLFLLAGRFGLAPTANRQTTAGLKLQDTGRSGQFTSDPAGFTLVDVIALGTMGHVIGTGIILGLKLDGVIPW